MSENRYARVLLTGNARKKEHGVLLVLESSLISPITFRGMLLLK